MLTALTDTSPDTQSRRQGAGRAIVAPLATPRLLSGGRGRCAKFEIAQTASAAAVDLCYILNFIAFFPGEKIISGLCGGFSETQEKRAGTTIWTDFDVHFDEFPELLESLIELLSTRLGTFVFQVRKFAP
jgi:hypothetical protein